METGIVKKEMPPSFIERLMANSDTLEEVKKVGEVIIASGFCPDHFKTSKDAVGVVMCIEAGRQLGLTWMQSLSDLYPVKGRIGMMGAAARSLIFSSGVLDKWEEKTEGEYPEDQFKHIIISKRKGLPNEFRSEFSVHDAKKAGLFSKDIYQRYGKRMIMWRNIGFHATDFYGDVMKGFKTVEELNDFDAIVPGTEITTITNADGNEMVIKGADKGRSTKLTEVAVNKIKEKSFTPVAPPQKEQPKPDPPHIANAQDDMGMADQPVYEGPHNVGPPSKEPPLTQEQINAMTGGPRDLPWEHAPEQPPQQQQAPASTETTSNKLTIAQMSEMDTEDLMKLIQNDSEMAEALMLIPGKNTNKKLREIIFAYQEGTLAEHVKPFLSEGEQTPPEEGTTTTGEPPAPEPELEQPATSDLNKYNLEIPPWNKGNERDFATTRLLYQRMLDLNPRLDNERFLELQQKLPQFSNHVSKEAFCKYASVEDVCLLLNNN